MAKGGRKKSIDACWRDAEAGTSEAQFRLGLIYSTGSSEAPLDFILAHKWLNLAARSGNGAARELRREIAGDMSRDQIAAAQRLAREWLQTH